MDWVLLCYLRSSLGRRVESCGTYVIITRHPRNRRIKGRIDLPISTRDRFMIAIATNRFRPKGGVRKPHSMLTIMMIP